MCVSVARHPIVVFGLASRAAIAVMAIAGAAAASAADVGVVGLFPGKVVLSIDGGSPRTLSVGEKTADGIKVLSVGGDDALLEIDGKSRRVGLGEQVYSNGAGATGNASVTLTANSNGQFMASGTINGASVRFMVDTGATYVSLGASDARRAGIEVGSGEPGTSITANGPIRVWRVRLNSIRVGDVTMTGVDAAIQETDLPVALLGMSFLNRMDMRRNGDSMVLRKRF
jgi:aspartyl protease family protein